MLQGSDPFDEFRTKREIQRLESDFQNSAQKKRKRLKELLEEDDGRDPDGVEQQVQEEMESFFRESATSAESVFAEVGHEVEVGIQEIQQRIDEVLRPVEDPTPEASGPDAAESPEEPTVEAALARLRGDGATATRPAEEESADGMPDWLDVTEETIEENRSSDGNGADEAPAARRERLLGAFDESLGRFNDLIREGARTAIVELEAEGEETDVPLARRAEVGGFANSIPDEPLEGESVGDAAEVEALRDRVASLELDVSRLRKALVRRGILPDETA